MTTKRTVLFLLLFGLVLLLPTGLAPLLETTEARYGEIAREMLANGDYLEPRFNGIKHFHKPPLTYWAIASGMRLFGQNDFGARFFGVVAAVIAVAFVYRLARVVLDNESRALQAAVIFATSALFLAVSRIAATDIYLTACTVAAQFYLFRQIYGERRRGNAIAYGLCLGLGFMVKGPIILLFTLLPYLVAKLFDARHRKVFTPADIALAVLVFAAVALPWYLVVIVKNPDLLEYFLKTQTVDRVATDHFQRHQPAWYFLAIFAGTFFPYLLFLLKGARHLKELARPVQLLLVYVLVPLLVFSVAKSKLPTYILPFYGVASLFAAAAYGCFPMPRLRKVVLVTIGLLALLPPFAALVVKPMPGWLQVALVAATLPALGLAWQAFRTRARESFLLWTAAALLLFGTAGYAVYGTAAHQTRGYERMLERINAADPQRQLPVMVYRHFLPSVSFYRGTLAVMALGMDRETQFEDDPAYLNYYLDDKTNVKGYLQSHPELFLIIDTESLEKFTNRYKFACEELYVQKELGVYRCRQENGRN
jgi:4-amino-4-deoxy-L-arabinose transferase